MTASPRKINRRQALAGTLSAVLSQSAFAPLARASGESLDEKTLAAFVDVLLPADANSPSASTLHVPAEILELAEMVPLFKKLISLATKWLNNTGNVPFHELSEADKTTLVTWMSTSDFNQFPRRFFHLVRLAAVEIYFSHPDAIQGYPLNPSPQPEGYPPPWA
ncbi:MAG: gluconate 2-dehydrogenase subunit 3 family protein [Rhodobacteraceae bacterium]|nr:gluconate 2-dehydrogenase subunit 3 family protein [Paracoccaceae bacterium]